MTNRAFAPGFRLSMLDVVILAMGVVASLAFSRVDRSTAAAIAFVVAHFFLFCNLLRMSRPLELVWAGVFATLAIAAVTFSLISWSWVFAGAGSFTLVLALIEIRKPSYHGIGWRSVNPALPEWWRDRNKV